MPKGKPTPLGRIRDIARSQLPTIAAMWDAVSGSTIVLLNRLRSLYDLASQSEAAQLYREATGYAATSAGQATLGVRPLFDPWDTPINVDLQSPFGAYGQYRYTVSFGIGENYFSFVEWSDRVPTSGSIQQAVADYVREFIAHYPDLSDMINQNGFGGIDIRVRGAQRRY